jgi:2-aminoadipate transaminase
MPAGGFFHWLHLKPPLTATAVQAAAAERGVAVTPGTGYFAGGGGEQYIRLVFSALPPDELREAMTRFTDAVQAVAAQKKR